MMYGDMYSPDIIDRNYNGKRSIVVSVNRCFDTIVDDHLVSHKSQHGQVFQKLYDDQKYTPESLNSKISDLLGQNMAYEVLSLEKKPKGNSKRYDVGTTVNLRIDDKLSYYLLGLSIFDEHLNAHTSKADFALAGRDFQAARSPRQCPNDRRSARPPAKGALHRPAVPDERDGS